MKRRNANKRISKMEKELAKLRAENEELKSKLNAIEDFIEEPLTDFKEAMDGMKKVMASTGPDGVKYDDCDDQVNLLCVMAYNFAYLGTFFNMDTYDYMYDDPTRKTDYFNDLVDDIIDSMYYDTNNDTNLLAGGFGANTNLLPENLVTEIVRRLEKGE